MAIIDPARELQFKIVYYGPAGSGKTTNLEQVYADLPDTASKSKMTSLAVSSDRTLFFDFAPPKAAVIKDFKTRFALFTTPGKVVYNYTRQRLLRDVDGIVFVADSQPQRMEENIALFRNLEENLEFLKLSLDDIPYVLQYNKRDLPRVASVADLENALNNHPVRVPSFPAIARICEGVRETFNMVGSMVVQKFRDDGGSSPGGAPKPAPLNPFSPPALSAHAELPKNPD
jgi:hypothetical protein